MQPVRAPSTTHLENKKTNYTFNVKDTYVKKESQKGSEGTDIKLTEGRREKLIRRDSQIRALTSMKPNADSKQARDKARLGKALWGTHPRRQGDHQSTH